MEFIIILIVYMGLFLTQETLEMFLIQMTLKFFIVVEISLTKQTEWMLENHNSIDVEITEFLMFLEFTLTIGFSF